MAVYAAVLMRLKNRDAGINIKRPTVQCSRQSALQTKSHSLRQTYTILSIFYLRKVKFSPKYSIKEYRQRNDVEVYDAALLFLQPER